MPFVEGESLRDRLVGMTRLSIEQAVRIAREAAQALSYAHRHNIIHRDIKPENILLTDEGNTLVADFGIARAIHTVTSSGTRRSPITEVGTVIGTPAYMSPEQRVGVAVDIRTDIYSLGVVLMEMLTGQTPGGDRGLNPLKAIKKNESIPVRQLRPEIPAGLEQVVQRALTIDPTRRFQSMEEFDEALEQFTGPKRKLAPPPRRYVALAAGLAALAVVGIYGATRHSSSGATGPGKTVRIAVLPFANQGDTSSSYFAGGLTDAVRAKLTGMPGLEVIASTSSSLYEGTSKTPRQIGDELGVEYLLVGKVRKRVGTDGVARVQVTPELIAVSSGAAKWAQGFDASVTDVFQMQTDIAEKVVVSLDGVLDASGRQQLAEKPTANLQAYDYFLRAEAASIARGRTDPAATRVALPLYRQAVTLDPSFALAWAQISRLHTNNYIANLDPGERDGAIDAANRAIELAPARVDGHLARAIVSRTVGDTASAKKDYEAARRIAPNEPRVLRRQAQVAMEQGRREDAVAIARKALSLDPRSANSLGGMINTLLPARRFAEAESMVQVTLTLTPENPGLLYEMAYARLGRGDLAAAKRVIAQPPPEQRRRDVAIYLAIYGDFYWLLDTADQEVVLTGTMDEFEGDIGSYGLVKAEISAARGDMAKARSYADSGRRGFEDQLKNRPEDGQGNALLSLTYTYLDRRADALAAIKRALVAPQSLANVWYTHDLAARVYVRIGETEKAIDEIEAALKGIGPVSPGYYRLHPAFASLKGHPRFETLVAEKQ